MILTTRPTKLESGQVQLLDVIDVDSGIVVGQIGRLASEPRRWFIRSDERGVYSSDYPTKASALYTLEEIVSRN